MAHLKCKGGQVLEEKVTKFFFFYFEERESIYLSICNLIVSFQALFQKHEIKGPLRSFLTSALVLLLL